LNPFTIGSVTLALLGLGAAIIAFASGLSLLGMLVANPFFILGLVAFIATLYTLKKAMEIFNDNKFMVFSASLQGFDNVLKEVNSLESKKVKLAVDLAAAGTEYHKTKTESNRSDSFVEVIKNLNSTLSNIGRDEKSSKIEIYIDGRILDERYVTIKEFKNAMKV
jgi:hypothetical protein